MIPRFISVSDGIEASVWDTEKQSDLFPTLSGNRKYACKGCGIGTAEMIALALNYYVENVKADRHVVGQYLTGQCGSCRDFRSNGGSCESSNPAAYNGCWASLHPNADLTGPLGPERKP